MKSNTPVSNTIRKQTAVVATPRLVVEFNHNRYTPLVAENSPPANTDSRHRDILPIESIAEPNRPTKGIVKASLDTAILLPEFRNPVRPTVRYHIAEQEDKYKYWTSITQCAASPSYEFGTHPDSLYTTGVNPHVAYSALVKANKIVIGMETSQGFADAYEIFVRTTVGGAWTKIADQTNTDINADGQIILYRQASSWTETKTLVNSTNIAGVQLRVTSMNSASKYFELIEISARFESDITDYLISVSDTFDLGDPTIAMPVGAISSNIATINLFNSSVGDIDANGLLFNINNVNSPYYGLLQENAMFTLDYIYDASAQSGTSSEVIRQFEMYAMNKWSADLEESISVSVRDYSKFFQETKCPQLYYESEGQLTISEIMWQICDVIGFVDINIQAEDVINTATINHFWSTGEETVWEIFNQLAEATQTVIYIDGNGILQVKTRNTALDPTDAAVWTLRGADSGVELADIVSINNEEKATLNALTVKYQPVSYPKTSNDNFLNQIVWEPEEDIVMLRSSSLQRDCLIGHTDLYMDRTQVANWPFEGMIQTEGELIKYKGKEYSYVDSTDSNIIKTVILSSQDDYQKYLYKTNTNLQIQNTYTGRVIITERGAWNTEERDHKVAPFPYVVRNVYGSANYPLVNSYHLKKHPTWSRETGFSQPDTKATIKLMTNNVYGTAHWLLATNGGDINGDAPDLYGTRFKFNSADGTKHLTAGIAMSLSGTGSMGYYVEIRPTDKATSGTYEIVVYSKSNGGTINRKNGKGWRRNIIMDEWYDLDVELVNPGAGNHYITVWLNGAKLGVATISSDKATNSDDFGMFVRGSTSASYEYLYAYNTGVDWTQWGDDVSVYDRTYGGYRQNQSAMEFSSDVRPATRTVKKKLVSYTQRYKQAFFDEFTPVLHETRLFDVKFKDNVPGRYGLLTSTNKSIKILDYRATPFTAQFYAVNALHFDTNLHGTLNEVDNKCVVIAQTVTQSEEKKLTFENAESIKANGRKEFEFSNKWVQSDEQATAVGEWVKNHWGESADEITVVVFGNPLIEVTDVVLVTDPQSGRVDEKYFVIETTNEFEQGLSTTLRLRKANV